LLLVIGYWLLGIWVFYHLVTIATTWFSQMIFLHLRVQNMVFNF